MMSADQILPPTVLFSVFMGDLKNHFKHVPFLFESMRRNPAVDFVIINVIPDGSDLAKETMELLRVMNVKNVILKVVSFSEFDKVVKERLDIEVKFESQHFYKLCDYKPTLSCT